MFYLHFTFLLTTTHMLLHKKLKASAFFALTELELELELFSTLWINFMHVCMYFGCINFHRNTWIRMRSRIYPRKSPVPDILYSLRQTNILFRRKSPQLSEWQGCRNGFLLLDISPPLDLHYIRPSRHNQSTDNMTEVPWCFLIKGMNIALLNNSKTIDI